MWLLKKWRQLWCFHYWRKRGDNRLVAFHEHEHQDEWVCVYCGRAVVTDWDKPPLSYVE